MDFMDFMLFYHNQVLTASGYYFAVGYDTVSPQEFPAPMIFASCGDLLFRQKKKAKLIQEVS